MTNDSHRARKRFGQNFLHDDAVIHRIVQCINPSRTDALVEIGPGKGALTFPLLQQVDSLTALELDRDLHKRLTGTVRKEGYGTLIVHNIDALTVNFTELASTFSQQNGIRVVGNLPYNISTPLLFHLLNHRDSISDMHFMLQKEVVDRITASPGSKTYGRLSVMMQTYCETEELMSVPPEAFDPAPAVQSAIVRLKPVSQTAAEGWANPEFSQLEATVKLAFAQRRKTLRNNFKGVLTESDFERCGINPGARAETLDLQAFAKLASQSPMGLTSVRSQ